MNGLIRASLRNPYAVTVFCLTLVLLGAVSVYMIPRDILPVFKSPAVQVLTFYSGMPAARISSASRRADNGVSSAGLSTTVFPQASAGPSFQLAMLSGKFQGTIRPTTPSGSRKVRSTPPATISTGC